MTEVQTSEIKRTPLVELFITIKSWFFFLLRKWFILLIAAIIGGLLGIWKAWTTKPIYQSELTFALDEGGSGSMSGALGIAAQLGINLGGNNNDVFGGDNIIEIIKSRRNIETALLSVDSTAENPETLMNEFMTIYEWNKPAPNNKISDVKFPAGVAKKDLSYLQDSVLYLAYATIITNNLVADHPDKRLNIYEVSVVSLDEKFTKILTDKLVNYATAFYTSIKTKKSLETLDILQKRADTTKQLLSSSIGNKAASQDANTNPAFAAAQVPMQKQQANIQVYGNAYAELYKNLELARFEYLKDIPLLQVIDAADYPMKRTKPGRFKTGVVGACIAVCLGIIILAFFQFVKQVKKTETVKQR